MLKKIIVPTLLSTSLLVTNSVAFASVPISTIESEISGNSDVLGNSTEPEVSDNSGNSEDSAESEVFKTSTESEFLATLEDIIRPYFKLCFGESGISGNSTEPEVSDDSGNSEDSDESEVFETPDESEVSESSDVHTRYNFVPVSTNDLQRALSDLLKMIQSVKKQ